MWMESKLPLLQKSGKGGLGWQTPKPTSEGSIPTRKQRPQARHPQTLNYKKLQGTQKSTQETQTGNSNKKSMEAEMERLNSKYNLDCFQL